MLNERYFTELYEQYYKKIYNYIFYRTLSQDIADDLTSQIFLKIIEKYPTYSSEKASISTWIFHIAQNSLIDFYRKNSRIPGFQPLEDNLSAETSPETDLIKKEEQQILLNALKTLSPKERSILSLRYFWDMSYHDIAIKTNLTEKNVSVILSRTKNKLMKLCLEQ